MIRPETQDELLSVDLPRDAACAAEARKFIRERLGEKVAEPALQAALLTASELVNNAWKHGEGKIELRLGRRGDVLRIEVVDEGTGSAAAIRAQAGADGGWGLRIVDRIAERWGCFDGATHVWADVPAEVG